MTNNIILDQYNVVLQTWETVLEIVIAEILQVGTELPFGTKSSAGDAGVLGQQSNDDDYLYICTTAGTAGNAIWKMTPLMRT